MCKPLEEKHPSVMSVLMEIMSASTCLHMQPEPVEDPDGDYLSDTDVWAAHSIEHMSAARDKALRVSEELRGLSNILRTAARHTPELASKLTSVASKIDRLAR